jgi:MbtH protein
MANSDDDDTTIYRVLVNHEEQYSLWPSYLEIPAGWREAGKSGPKDDCLAFVREVWTDMRPLSVRDGTPLPSGEGQG